MSFSLQDKFVLLVQTRAIVSRCSCSQALLAVEKAMSVPEKVLREFDTLTSSARELCLYAEGVDKKPEWFDDSWSYKTMKLTLVLSDGGAGKTFEVNSYEQARNLLFEKFQYESLKELNKEKNVYYFDANKPPNAWGQSRETDEYGCLIGVLEK